MGRDQEKSSSDEAVNRREALDAHRDTHGRFSEFLLLGTGLLQFLTGAALIIVPSALPQYAWIVHGLARRGITGLPLYVGGVVLTGLWLSSRSNRTRSRLARESAAAASAAILQLSTEVGHLGDGLQGMRIEFVYLKDALQTQLERPQPTTDSDNAPDAMFRIAASLDQLGARLEERLITSHRELGQALQAVANTVEALQTLSAAPPIQLQAEDDRRPEPTSSSNHAQHAHSNSEAPETASAKGDESWDHVEPDRQHRLGLLDMLDDLGRILPRKTSLSLDRPTLHTRIETDPFEEVQDEGWEHASSIPGPMPAAHTGDELRLQGPGELLAGGSPHVANSIEDTPLGEKLAELGSLLADVRVREALASIERGRK